MFLLPKGLIIQDIFTVTGLLKSVDSQAMCIMGLEVRRPLHVGLRTLRSLTVVVSTG